VLCSQSRRGLRRNCAGPTASCWGRRPCAAWWPTGRKCSNGVKICGARPPEVVVDVHPVRDQRRITRILYSYCYDTQYIIRLIPKYNNMLYYIPPRARAIPVSIMYVYYVTCTLVCACVCDSYWIDLFFIVILCYSTYINLLYIIEYYYVFFAF
jgi:hypothetical protein